MQFDAAELNSTILDIVTDVADEYEATEAVDYAARCAELKPGSTVPKKGGLMLNSNREHFDFYSYDAQEKIKSLCAEKRNRILDEMGESPSQEALRGMQSIILRDDVSKVELDAFASKYGSNYQVRRFVTDQLSKRKLAMPYRDECDAALKAIEHAEEVGLRSVKSRDIERAKYGKAARLAIVRDELNGTGLFSLA